MFITHRTGQQHTGNLLLRLAEGHRNTAIELRKKIEDLVNAGSTSIYLVCHSMGGIIGRLVLEDPTNWQLPWFNKITKFVAICTPHKGAPAALTQALGAEDSTTISAEDIKRIAADHRYPAGYQLFPDPTQSNAVLYDFENQRYLNIYDYGDDNAVGLDTNNVDIGKQTFDRINSGRPPNVEYTSVAGTGHNTESKIELYNSKFYVFDDSDYGVPLGDGTVPLSSADLTDVTHYVTPGDHIGIFTSYQFRKILYAVLAGAHAAPAVMMPDGSRIMSMAIDGSGMTVSVSKKIFLPSEKVTVVLIPDIKTGKISGELKLVRAIKERDVTSFITMDTERSSITRVRV